MHIKNKLSPSLRLMLLKLFIMKWTSQSVPSVQLKSVFENLQKYLKFNFFQRIFQFRVYNTNVRKNDELKEI